MDTSLSGPSPADRLASDLEQRVERLEGAVASLEDTRALEERVTENVIARIENNRPFTQREPVDTPAQPVGPSLDPQPLSASASTVRPLERHPWLFFDMISSARWLWRMMLDSRYHMAWTTHLVVWLFLPAILFSSWWFPLAWLPIVGHYLDKVLDLILGFCIYKALSRELRRYRELVERS